MVNTFLLAGRLVVARAVLAPAHQHQQEKGDGVEHAGVAPEQPTADRRVGDANVSRVAFAVVGVGVVFGVYSVRPTSQTISIDRPTKLKGPSERQQRLHRTHRSPPTLVVDGAVEFHDPLPEEAAGRERETRG